MSYNLKESKMKKLFVLLLLLAFVFVQPVFAQSMQTGKTDKGALNVELSFDPENPGIGDEAKMEINFVNPMTKKTQEHIDYRVEVSKGDKIIFKTDTLLHTAVGTIKIPIQFPEDGTYTVNISVEGILFSPIPPEMVKFDVPIGQSPQPTPTPAPEKKGGGCLIATAAYGTELAPQVQFLREIRDNTVLSTSSGAAFMTGFNQFYYSFSPTVADWERENPVFQESVRAFITPMVSSLSILTLADQGSEPSVLGFGLAVIAFNIGLYIAGPTVVGFKVHKYLKSRK